MPACPGTSPDGDAPVVSMRGVTVRLGGRDVVAGLDWVVRAGERWVVLGPNGSGKTTLIRLAGALIHPTAGTVTVAGERIGRVDVRRLRPRLPVASAALARAVHPAVTALEVVMCGRTAALEPWWDTWTDSDREQAAGLLERLGVGALADQPFGTLSAGEQQRVLVARTLMADPALVLLDEPTAGLDLAGRETLIGTLGTVAADPSAPPMVLVTHHPDEIPPGFTHLLALRGGRPVASGPLPEVLDADLLSRLFGLDIALHRVDGRWFATAASSRRPGPGPEGSATEAPPTTPSSGPPSGR